MQVCDEAVGIYKEILTIQMTEYMSCGEGRVEEEGRIFKLCCENIEYRKYENK